MPAGKTIRATRLGVDGRVLDDRYHGIGRVTYELVERLAGDDEWQITLFLNHTQRTGRFDVQALLDRPGVTTVWFDHALDSPRQFLRWPGTLRRSGVDVALFPYHLGAALAGPARRFAIVHDCIFEVDPRFAPDTRTRALYLLLTKIVVRRNRVLTGSKASAAALRHYHGVAVPDSRVVEWGVEQSFGAPTAAVAVVNGTDIPERYYLHIGARRPHKNVAQLVRVLAGLHQDEYLVLVGSRDPRWPDPSVELAADLGVGDRVIQLSGVSEADLLSLYAGARGFLYPSLVEGFGLPLLEAMAAGVPVIASDIPVFRELVEGHALLVPVSDTPGWVSAIRSLDDPARRDQLVQSGLARAEAATWDRTATRLARILASP